MPKFSRTQKFTKATIANIPNNKAIIYKIKNKDGKNLYTGIAETKPWEMIKNGDNEKAGGILLAVSEAIRHIAWMLKPFMPETADKIFDILNIADTESGKTLEEARKWGSVEFKEFKKADGLFPRI
ncbi:hypothetical protein ACFL2L_01210 [Patescibacteria group bacterium]